VGAFIQRLVPNQPLNRSLVGMPRRVAILFSASGVLPLRAGNLQRLPSMKSRCALISLAMSIMAGPAFAVPKTHCKSNEVDFFSCAIAGSRKVASLCGNRDDETKQASWLQYRFGLVGHPEMIYPTSRHGSLDKFFRNRVYSRGSSYTQYDIWFHVGAYNYSVSASQSEGEAGHELSVYVYFNNWREAAKGNPYVRSDLTLQWLKNGRAIGAYSAARQGL